LASAVVFNTLAAIAAPPARAEQHDMSNVRAVDAQTPQVMTGKLHVQAQIGLGCSAQPATPYEIPVQAVPHPDGRGWILWGAMQTMLAKPSGQEGTLHLQVLGEDRMAGHLTAAKSSASSLQMAWREAALPGNMGCVYSTATLHLDPVANDALASASRAQAMAGVGNAGVLGGSLVENQRESSGTNTAGGGGKSLDAVGGGSGLAFEGVGKSGNSS
jgi:hypothetical protein